MHEAGLAATVVDAVVREGLAGRAIRVFVRGGHGDAEAFDAALVAHIVADARWGDATVAIEHVPEPRLCSACGNSFLVGARIVSCPDCGGQPLPTAGFEEIAIELDDPPPAEVG